MILYKENPKELAKKKKKVLELISNYNKAAGYKVNIKKSITFLYTSNEQVEFEIKNRAPFTLTPIKMKYLDHDWATSLRYRSNKICVRSTHGKLQNS